MIPTTKLVRKVRQRLLTLTAMAAAGGVPAQTPNASFELAGTALAGPKAEFDLFGELRVSGKEAGGAERTLALRFAELEPPAAGEHAVGDATPLTMLLDGKRRQARLTIEHLGAERTTMRGEIEALGGLAATAFAVDLPAPAPAAIVRGGKPGVTEPAPAAEPKAEDLVFAALGNTGTGDDDQHHIGRSLGKLAATGPLDLALLLGDIVLPAGVKGNDDPAWHRCFEGAYPDLELPVPFHAVLGDRDHRGNVSSYTEYGLTSARFRYPNFAYTFTTQSHGVEILFVGIDTTLYGQGVRHPAMRFINRVATTRLTESKAAIKIVFGHQTMFGHGPTGREAEAAKLLRSYMLPMFEKAGVGLYISAGDHHQELLQHGSMVEVVTGTGGGRARSVECGADTLFASTSPGFAWFRTDGKQVEVSFRDRDGAVLHVHRWQPAQPQ